MSTKRIVCYAINGAGMGHLTRLTAIARWMRRFVALLDQRTPEIFFLTSSDASDTLADAGFAAFKLPSKTVARKTELNKLDYRRLAKHFVWNTLGVFSPDLLVVDTFPAGSFDELFQVLDGPFCKGFIYRNVKPEYAARPTFRSAKRLYDTVVVPHSGSKDSNPRLVESTKTHYCGEVIQYEHDELLARREARRQLGVAESDRLVYVSAGGGGDPNAEDNLVALVEGLRNEPNVRLLVGAGPLYRGQRISGPRVTWFDAPSVWRYFSALDAAVCAAGYNTFHELIYARIPTAFFAQPKIADDQAKRIAEAQEVGACRSLMSLTDSAELVANVRALLDPVTANEMRGACGTLLPVNGARQCALKLLAPMYDAPRLEWAADLLTPQLTHALERIGKGSTNVLPDWLTPLMPQDQVESVGQHPGMSSVLNRISSAAAEEVRQALAADNQSSDWARFEACLTELLTSVEVYQRDGGLQQPLDDASKVTGIGVADEVLKTLVASLKKQSWQSDLATAALLQGAEVGNESRTQWVCSTIEGVHGLLSLADARITELDVLQLFRLFPRIVDVGTQEAFELFHRYFERQRAEGSATHEIMRQLQLLKMAHSRVTREALEPLLEGSTI